MNYVMTSLRRTLFVLWVILVAAAASSPASRAASLIKPAYLVTVRDADSRDRVELLDTQGRLLRVLDSFGSLDGRWQASWSPDGRWLAWLEPLGLHVARADGSQARLLVRDRRLNMRYAWAPDSRRLAVANGAYLFTVRVTGGGVVELARPQPGTEYWPFGWTAAGVIARRDSGVAGMRGCCSASIIVARPKHEARTVWVYDSWHCDCSRPALSPDGARFAYYDEGRIRVVEMRTGSSRFVRGSTVIRAPFFGPTWLVVPNPPLNRASQLLSLDTRLRTQVRRLPE
jgi:hypothetical protein